METGLDWKQQERKKEIRCSAHLSTTPPLCPSLKIPLFNMKCIFKLITGFPFGRRAGGHSVCPTLRQL